MSKKLLANRKALSPIFATLIILAVVTILFVPVFIWTAGLISQSRDSTEASGIIASERIVIEEVNLKIGQTYCTIYVRNIGTTTVTINDVLIQKENGNIVTFEKSKSELTTTDPVTNLTKTSIIQGQLLAINIPALKSLTLTSGQLYTVQVFTTRGVGDQYQLEL